MKKLGVSHYFNFGNPNDPAAKAITDPWEKYVPFVSSESTIWRGWQNFCYRISVPFGHPEDYRDVFWERDEMYGFIAVHEEEEKLKEMGMVIINDRSRETKDILMTREPLDFRIQTHPDLLRMYLNLYSYLWESENRIDLAKSQIQAALNQIR